MASFQIDFASSLPLILASQSPRRRELLSLLGVPFTVSVSDAPEDRDADVLADKQALLIAGRKARAIANRGARGLILGADTIVVLDGEILGKPTGGDDAKSMLRRLAGRGHQVITGVVLLDTETGYTRETAVTSTVHMKSADQVDIDGYVATGEPRDKAGAYGIQGLGGALVDGYEGCFTNIVGLPLCAVAELLASAGVPVSPTWAGCQHASGTSNRKFG
ncbi:MAG: Maf family protein [Thermomicrobiales bacterium]